MAFEAADRFNSAHSGARTVSFETNAQGRRRFVACTKDRLWSRMLALPAGARHFYEIIREGHPCHLYLDIEFKRSVNPELDGGVLVSYLVTRLRAALRDSYGVAVSLADVLDLDSSTDRKFSRHVIVVMPDGSRFRDNQDAGRFVLALTARLAAEAPTSGLAARLWAVDGEPPPLEPEAGFTAASGDASAAAEGQAEDRPGLLDGRTPIIDLGVYTRNRAMRLYLASKYGRRATLMPAATNAFGLAGSRVSLVALDGAPEPVQAGPLEWERAVWDASFVTGWGDASAAGTGRLLEASLPPLAGIGPAGAAAPGVLAMYNAMVRGDGVVGRRRADGAGEGGQRAVASGQESPFPPVDAWVLQLAASRGGPPASVRSVSASCRSVRLHHPEAAGDTGSAADAPAVGAAMSVVSRLTFCLAGNRYCRRVRRQHRSNNVNWSVDLEARTAHQTCMDPECRGWRSAAVDVPDEVVPDQVPAGVRVELLPEA